MVSKGGQGGSTPRSTDDDGDGSKGRECGLAVTLAISGTQPDHSAKACAAWRATSKEEHDPRGDDRGAVWTDAARAVSSGTLGG